MGEDIGQAKRVISPVFGHPGALVAVRDHRPHEVRLRFPGRPLRGLGVTSPRMPCSCDTACKFARWLASKRIAFLGAATTFARLLAR